MATKAQWYGKLQGWLPQWWFSQNPDEAVLWGMAAVLEKLEGSLTEHQLETFILEAATGYLDEHGLERNLARFRGELNPPFAERIRNITNTTNVPAIKAIVDALLEIGEATIVEDYEASVFYGREHFFNRGEILIVAIYNVFSIIVDNQLHAPYSFYERANFYVREDFHGAKESSLELFELIVEAVNRAKALGTLYRLVERVG